MRGAGCAPARPALHVCKPFQPVMVIPPFFCACSGSMDVRRRTRRSASLPRHMWDHAGRAGAHPYRAIRGTTPHARSSQIPKFGIVLVVVLVLGALGFRDRKETDGTNLFC